MLAIVFLGRRMLGDVRQEFGRGGDLKLFRGKHPQADHLCFFTISLTVSSDVMSPITREAMSAINLFPLLWLIVGCFIAWSIQANSLIDRYLLLGILSLIIYIGVVEMSEFEVWSVLTSFMISNAIYTAAVFFMVWVAKWVWSTEARKFSVRASTWVSENISNKSCLTRVFNFPFLAS